MLGMSVFVIILLKQGFNNWRIVAEYVYCRGMLVKVIPIGYWQLLAIRRSAERATVISLKID